MELIDEIASGRGDQDRTLTRTYRHGRFTVQVRIVCGSCKESSAAAYVLNLSAGGWTWLCDNPAGNWHEEFLGTDSLAKVADSLAARAARILGEPAA